MSVRAIDEFVAGLRAIPEASFSRTRVLDEFGHTRIDAASLRRYMFFCPTHYTRNLIYRNELFEVLALVWEPGQASMIHNHRDQECWMGVPVGRLEVRNFRLVHHDPTAMSCRLEPSQRYLLDPTHAAAVDPSEPIHSVHNLQEFSERAVSIHVYSLPFDSCLVYQPEKERYFEVPLEYTSTYGTLCPGAPVQAVLA